MTTINTWDQIRKAGGGIMICYHSRNSRSCMSAKWNVIRINSNGKEIPTDPQSAWYNYGRKTFIVSGGNADKKAALQEAIEWVAKTYGEHGPWVRNRLGDCLPKRIHKQFPLRRSDD